VYTQFSHIRMDTSITGTPVLRAGKTPAMTIFTTCSSQLISILVILMPVDLTIIFFSVMCSHDYSFYTKN